MNAVVLIMVFSLSSFLCVFFFVATTTQVEAIGTTPQQLLHGR